MWQGTSSQVEKRLCVSAEIREIASLGIGGVSFKVCSVVLTLLLMAGDVETNPGPTGKEGNIKD